MRKIILITALLFSLVSCSTSEEPKEALKFHQKDGDEEIEPVDGDEVEALETDEETGVERKIRVKLYCKHAVAGGWDAYGMDSTGKWYIVRGRKTGITASAWGSPMPPPVC